MSEKKNVLIVDGGDDDVLALADAIKDKYAVLAVKDGEAAIETIRRDMPDLILLRAEEYLRVIEQVDMTDGLTKLPNRRYFEMQAAKEWERAIREKKVISVMLLDIDHFEEYNERFGHTEGDKLLCTLAEVLKSSIKRPSDDFARVEGDQFIAMLPGTYTEGAKELAEQIRLQVDTMAMPIGDGKTVTVSIGINTAGPRVGSSLDVFISGARKTLIAAKNAGGDCIRIV